MKRLFSFSVLMALTLVMFAQGATIPTDVTPSWIVNLYTSIVDFVNGNGILSVLAAIEFIFRVIPTAKDFTPLKIVVYVLDYIVANRKTGGGKFVTETVVKK